MVTAKVTPQFVSAIDFGTTHCSVAYLIRPDLAANKPSGVEPIVLELDNAGSLRVPNSILFNLNGNKMGFGYEARERFASLKWKLRPLYYYFEHVKKNLQNEKV